MKNIPLFVVILATNLVTAQQDFGGTQIRQVLIDRPSMSQYTTPDGKVHKLTPDDVIYKKALVLFDDSYTSWDASAPSVTCEFADHVMSPRSIRIATENTCAST